MPMFERHIEPQTPVGLYLTDTLEKNWRLKLWRIKLFPLEGTHCSVSLIDETQGAFKGAFKAEDVIGRVHVCGTSKIKCRTLIEDGISQRRFERASFGRATWGPWSEIEEKLAEITAHMQLHQDEGVFFDEDLTLPTSQNCRTAVRDAFAKVGVKIDKAHSVSNAGLLAKPILPAAHAT